MQTLSVLQNLSELTDAFFAMGDLERELQESLLEKRTNDNDHLIQKMEKLKSSIATLETHREIEFQLLLAEAGLPTNSGLRDILVLLAPTDRELLAEAYRNLKIAVLGVKAQAQGIDMFTRHSITVLKGVVDELYPERRQRTYTHRGRHREISSPMVLDHTL
jgi:hypothetical protein